jgi:hypothetical protein
MICRYTTNFQDFKNAQLLSIRSKRFGQLRYAFWFWILPIISIISFAALAYDIHWRHFGLKPLTGGMLAGIAWFGLWFLIMRPIVYRRLYKQMKNGRSDDAILELEIAGNEMISRIPGISEGRFFRKALFAFKENESIALIYLAKNKFLLLPKRTIDDEHMQQIREWVSQKEVA